MKRIFLFSLAMSMGIFTCMAQNDAISVFETQFGEDDLEIVRPGIADINGVLRVKLNQDSIARKLAKYENDEQLNQLVQEVENLNDLLRNQNAILRAAENDRSNNLSLEQKLAKLGEYSRYMNDFYNSLNNFPVLREEANALIAEYFSGTVDKSKYENHTEYMFEGLSKKASDMQQMINTSSVLEKYQILLVAFLHTGKERRRVHIENFDEYNLGEFYNVEQFVTSFSEEQIATFQATQQLADTLNALINTDFQEVKQLLLDSVQSLNCGTELLDMLQQLYEDRNDLMEVNKEVVKTYLDENKKLIQSILEDVAGIKDIRNLEPGQNALQLANRLQANLKRKTQQLPNQVDSLLNTLPAELRAANSPLFQIKDKFEECVSAVESDLEKLQNIIAWVDKILNPLKQSADASEEIGEEVLRFALNAIPEEGFIDLKYTGKRQSRDKLELKLMTETKGEDDRVIRKTLETMQITLQQIKLYSVTKINLILASPYNKTEKVALENSVQFAPSGSVLFKFGSRKSGFYNSFLDPGFGFNVSTPDFDLDGAPDFATGVIVTLIRDIVSAGWNFNTTTDSPFYFFGITLPVNIPGIPINNTQVESLN